MEKTGFITSPETQEEIDRRLAALKAREEHIRGVQKEELLLTKHGILETETKEPPENIKHNILRPNLKIPKINTRQVPITPEQPELFRDEAGDLVIKRPE